MRHASQTDVTFLQQKHSNIFKAYITATHLPAIKTLMAETVGSPHAKISESFYLDIVRTLTDYLTINTGSQSTTEILKYNLLKELLRKIYNSCVDWVKKYNPEHTSSLPTFLAFDIKFCAIIYVVNFGKKVLMVTKFRLF